MSHGPLTSHNGCASDIPESVSTTLCMLPHMLECLAEAVYSSTIIIILSLLRVRGDRPSLDSVRGAGTWWGELSIGDVSRAAAGLLAVLGEPSGTPPLTDVSSAFHLSQPFLQEHMPPQQV